MGTGWAAALTDFNYLRVYSTGGVQKAVISQGAPVVTMAGYENLLAIVYHQGPPVHGIQSTRMKVLDLNKSLSTIADTDFPISRYSKLIWLDFSREGLLCSYDTNGLLRSFLLSQSKWVPVLDIQDRHPETYKRMWI